MERLTEVVSARVTAEVAQALKGLAETNNLTLSKYLAHIATTVTPEESLRYVRGVKVPPDVDDKIVELAASIGGGSIIGSGAYKLLKGWLQSRKKSLNMTDGDVEGISTIAALALTIVSGLGIYKVLTQQSK